jgi:PTH2 family peptidyl-tRNA hydrolase
LKSEADAAGLPNYIVADFGLTEIPAGTFTALAIGPSPVELLDPITKKLKLL